MAAFFNYLLESSVISIMLFLLYHFGFAGYKNFTFNRIFLLTSVAFALAVPLLYFPFFAISRDFTPPTLQQVLVLPEVVIRDTSATLSGPHAHTWNTGMLVIAIYLAGVVFFLTRFLSQMVKIRLFIRHNRNKRIRQNGYFLLPTGGKIATCSFFDYLLWDETQELTAEQRQQIMEHEEAHIHSKHSYDVIVMRLLCIVFWFNPVIYLYKAALTTLHEYIADHKVAKGANVNDYIKLLSYQTLHAMKLTIGNNFFQTQIFKRMNMLRSKKRRSWWSRIALAIPVFSILFYVFACETRMDSSGTLPELPEGMVYINPEDAPASILEAYNLHKDGGVAVVHMANTTKSDGEIESILDNLNAMRVEIEKENDVASVYALISSDPRALEGKEKIKMVEEDVKMLPEPVGGFETLYSHIMREIKYPQEAREEGIEGKVHAEFVITEDGKMDSIKVIKGLGHGLDDEAIRALKNNDIQWNPGTHNGKPVNTKLVIPIQFSINTGEEFKTSERTETKKSPGEIDEMVVVGYK